MFSLNVPAKYSNTVYETIRPLYISSRLFGYSPFSATITRPSSNKIYLTKADCLLSTIHVLVYILCAVFNFKANVHDDLSSSKLLASGLQFELEAGCICCLILILVELVFRTSYWKIIESLNEFDLKFLTLDKTINHSKQKKLLKQYLILWFLMGFIFSIYSIVVLLSHYDSLTLLLFVASYSLMNGTFGTALTLYSFLILSLKVRFEAINDCLRDEGQLLYPVKVIEYINKGASRDKIVKLAQLHDKLTDIIGLINRRFSIQIMALVGADFIFSVFSLFSLYRVYSAVPFNSDEFHGSSLLVMWTLYYDFFVLTLIWLGSSVHSEGAYTGVLIHKIINNCTDKQTVEKLVLFSHQLNHQVPIATCKLFTFDWTLLFTLVAASTTYLTILIQFDSSFGGNARIVNNTNS